jgi:enoyl-CoA hydratase
VAAGSGPVRYERSGAAALVTIDRPERRNAIDGPTAEALHDAFRAFARDDGARVLVVTGAGEDAFCAGADLKALDTLGGRLDSAGGPLGFTRLASPKPTIAAVSGWCLAGGLELALWCDLRIVTADSTLGFPERRWGVPLIDGGTVRLPRLIGTSRAMDLVLTGRAVDAAEALAMGLANRVVPAGEALAAAQALARELAAFPQVCLRSDRASVLDQEGLDEPAALAAEFAHGRAALSAETVAGAARFAAGEGRHGRF